MTPRVLVMSVVIYRYLPDRPEDATFLDVEEKAWLVQRIQVERAALRGVGHQNH